MILEKLHKNSGKNMKFLTLGRLCLYFNMAEDGLWSSQNEVNTERTTSYLSMAKIERANDEKITKAYRLICWKFNIYITLLDRGDNT